LKTIINSRTMLAACAPPPPQLDGAIRGAQGSCMRITHSLITAALLLAPASALAHVTVWPKESVAGAWEKYDVRAPNEKRVDTVAVELTFPQGLRVVSFRQNAQWMTEVIRDSSGKATGVRWTGKLPPDQFAEFGLIAVNPASAGNLEWKAIQTYADGTKVEWSGPAASKTPAPRVTIKPAAGRR
jgi:uncharacterized protein YcnI